MLNSEDDSSILKPGTLIGNGRYEIANLLGRGGMGSVYTCKRKDLNDRVFAVKILNSNFSSNPKVASRFQTEVAAALDVSHPNIVRGYDYINEDGLIAYTMEFVEGGDLTRLIKLKAEISIQEAVRIITEVTKGVQALHSQGIIHRDLKPENVLLTSDDQIKISDFGIAIVENKDRRTSDSRILGTTMYLSPEYLLKNQIDKRSDIYSIGIIAYELLTKQHPFNSENIYQSIYKQIEYTFTPLRVLRSDCPPALGEIISKCLQAKPADRYSNCADLLSDLTNALSSTASVSREVRTRDLNEDSFNSSTHEDLEIKAASSFITEQSETDKPFENSKSVSSAIIKFAIFSGKIAPTFRSKLINYLEKSILIIIAISLNIIAGALLYPQIEAYMSKILLLNEPDAFTSRQQMLESISKTSLSWYENEVIIAEIKTNILSGHIKNLSINVSPKSGFKHTSLELEGAELKSKSLSEIGSGVYFGFLEGKLKYKLNGISKASNLEGKLNVIVFNDTGLVTVNFIIPVSSIGGNSKEFFYFGESEGEIIMKLGGETNFNVLD